MKTNTQERKEAQEHAKKALLKWFEETDTVYCSLNHVSTSGMTRHISFYIAVLNEYTLKPEIVNVTWHFAQILGMKRNKKDGGLVVSGCGMDMGFHIIHNLSYSLYGISNESLKKLNQQWL